MSENDQVQDYRWGIIGCGEVTEVKSGPALQQANGSCLTAVMRRNGALAQDYARRHNVPRWYDDADALVADPCVDLVYVATPPSSHKAHVLRAARAGKSVLVEKPMALNPRDCQEMIDACERYGVRLWVAYYRRCLPRFEKLRELIQSGAIGSPVAVTIAHFRRGAALPTQAWKVDPAVNGGGIFVDVQAHTLDWLDHVFGPARECKGVTANVAGSYEAEDTVSVAASFGDVVVSAACAYASNRDEEWVRIHGSDGELEMSFFAPAPVILRTPCGQGQQETQFDLPDPAHVHQPLVQQIVDEMRGGSPCVSTGQSGKRATQLLSKIVGRGSSAAVD